VTGRSAKDCSGAPPSNSCIWCSGQTFAEKPACGTPCIAGCVGVGSGCLRKAGNEGVPGPTNLAQAKTQEARDGYRPDCNRTNSKSVGQQASDQQQMGRGKFRENVPDDQSGDGRSDHTSCGSGCG